ncbi:MAG: GH3 auxin-responsive promoter family protein [Dehalococcoidia bacterium]
MIQKDRLFFTPDQERIWQKYCGFLDLSLDEFMEMQEHLLREQINLIYGSSIAEKLMPERPKDVSEFRQLVPLTTYKDYTHYLNNRSEYALPVKPYLWARTSGRGGAPKWVPYTEPAVETIAAYSVGLMILASTTRKGRVNISPGLRMLHNLPPSPYMSGIFAETALPLIDARLIPPLDEYADADFETRTQAGFQIALRTGVDMLGSLSSVLVKIGEGFSKASGKMSFSGNMLHPWIMWRLIRAWLKSRIKRRPLLPKDLWPVRGIICYGTDTDIYRDRILNYWGRKPLELYGATETGLIATGAWNKKSMTFVPLSGFLEFIPESQWLENRDNKNYQPSTVLLDEVKPGERYEVVFTSFHGMPFLRYRLGDLIRIIALEDNETGIKLPQMVFEGRVDEIIDIAGFSRLDEKTLWRAIAKTGIGYEDWSARKEYEQNQPIVRLYIELKESMEAEEVAEAIHQLLASVSQDYGDLEGMLGLRPLRVALLPPGSFRQYYDEKQRSGADLAHLKPPHMNASDAVIRTLLGN